jgi:hypothetical protein
MKFDVSPSGVHQTGQGAKRQGQDMDADVQALLNAFADAANDSGGGPIAYELARLAADVEDKTGIMSSRVTRTVFGAGQAADAHVEGDHDMAKNANQCKAGTESAGADMPGQGGH